MKIFHRGESKPAEAPQPEPAPPVQAAPPAPPVPDLTAIIDANVKEMSEKIARLATTIESDHSDRADFEAKLEKMEERMRKLSSLTEMISAQYNPFVGNAPAEREPMPSPEVGLAAPAAAVPVVVAALPTPLQALESTLDAPPVPAAFHDDAAPGIPPVALPGAAPAVAAGPGHAPREHEGGSPARLWSIPDGFAGSLLALNWADMLLRSAPSREALVQLVDYYQGLGWIGQPARDQLLAYAEGLATGPDAPGRGDWRAHADLHEKTLLYVEKLRVLAGQRGN